MRVKRRNFRRRSRLVVPMHDLPPGTYAVWGHGGGGGGVAGRTFVVGAGGGRTLCDGCLGKDDVCTCDA